MKRVLKFAMLLSVNVAALAAEPDLSPCSGVPGDFRTPNPGVAVQAPTHGPSGTGNVIEYRAVRSSADQLPPLYVFDYDAGYVNSPGAWDETLKDPIFSELSSMAYWAEGFNGRTYWIPNFDKCSIAGILGEAVSFKAPLNGLLFVQIVSPQCEICDRVTKALEEVVLNNPELPVRWVRIQTKIKSEIMPGAKG